MTIETTKFGHEFSGDGPPCMGCGYPVDSFACRIRHIQMNTGEAKAAND